jgi:hypothetical protein
MLLFTLHRNWRDPQLPEKYRCEPREVVLDAMASTKTRVGFGWAFAIFIAYHGDKFSRQICQDCSVFSAARYAN